jgi:hypothetical protein
VSKWLSDVRNKGNSIKSGNANPNPSAGNVVEAIIVSSDNIKHAKITHMTI